MGKRMWVTGAMLFFWAAGVGFNGNVGAVSTDIVITEVAYNGTTPTYEGDEFVELYNMTYSAIDISGYRIGDEEIYGGGEGMYIFPAGAIMGANAYIIVAKNAHYFQERFGFLPDFEMVTSGAGYVDMQEVQNLVRDPSWGTGYWSLSNAGDEVLLMDSSNNCVDGIRYGNSDWTGCGLQGIPLPARKSYSIQRLRPGDSFMDTDDMAYDFAPGTPTPGYSHEWPRLPIGEAKKYPDGTMVHVRGNVTVPKGTFSNSEIYIQDDTGGIKIFRSYSGGGIPGTVDLGNDIEVTGTIMSYRKEREVDISAQTSSMTNLGGSLVPQIEILSTHDSMLEANEGLLVEISGTVKRMGGGFFYMDDGSGPAYVYIDYTTGIRLTEYAGFGGGAIVRVAGVASQYNATHELKPRFFSDIEVLKPAPVLSQLSHSFQLIMKGMSYAASNNIAEAEGLSLQADNLMQEALEKGLDTSGCEVMIEEADRLLEMANEILSGNPIGANNFALKASVLLREAIRCLEALLG